MSRRPVGIGFGLAVVVTAASVAGVRLSSESTVREQLVPLDSAHWSPGDHPLGRGAVSPANVEPRREGLRLRLDADAQRGGEVVSRRRYGDGVFGARLRLPLAPGSLTGLFLYEPPDLQSEIDIELVNDREGRILFTVYHRGRERHVERRLDFDPTAGFHEYSFERGRDAVRFLVDGQIFHRFGDPLPRAPMRLHVNAWWPSWLESERALAPRWVDIDWVKRPPE